MSYFDNIRTFVRVYELGGMSAARHRPAGVARGDVVADLQLEDYLSIRLFQRTRSLTPTEQGRAFYAGACDTRGRRGRRGAGRQHHRQSERVALRGPPLGVGRRLIAPNVPDFLEAYPQVNVRLRLTDRKVDVTTEGLDLAFSWTTKTARCASARSPCPASCARRRLRGPARDAPDGDDLVGDGHECLNLRYPGATEFQWRLTNDSPKRFGSLAASRRTTATS